MLSPNKKYPLQKNSGYFLFIALIIIVVLLGLVGYLAERAAVASARQRMDSTLVFQTATLKAGMEKYAVLVALVAKRPDIIYALITKDPLKELPKVDELTSILAGMSGASDVWIVDKQGIIVVSNQFSQQTLDISDESYFQSALQGSLGRASVVTAAGQRLYIFSSPVISKNNVVGAIVVRIDIEYLEQVWALLPDPMLVSDSTGRVLLSNIRSWRLHYFFSEDEEEKSDVTKTYLVENFADKSRTQLVLHDAVNGAHGREYLVASQFVPLLGWHVSTMVNYASIASSRNTAILIALLLIAVIIMGGGMLVNRQNRLRKEQRSQQAFALRLERQVRDRTFALTEANQRLEVEVDERRIAEKNLRETQEELVQAAKLAGIGQMSAALAHEYNQPLAAIRSYADNALIFLTKDQANSAADNLQRIKMLTDKMAGLTRTLRNFAHKSTGRYESVSLEAVMDELIILLSPQAKKLRVKLQLLPPSLPLSVLGDYGRLSQIMTNLTTNAMDAVADSENKRVEITWQQREDKAVISVKDTGSGIDPAVREKMFTAFFTTKNPGSGLGLGLFIVINIVNDLKGTLSIKDEPGYGAVFEVSLPLAE